MTIGDVNDIFVIEPMTKQQQGFLHYIIFAILKRDFFI